MFGGTGPVGMCVALLAAQAGAECAIVSHQGLGAGQLIADRLSRDFDVRIVGVDGSSPAAIADWLPDMAVLMSAAKAGVEVVSAELLRLGGQLRVLADANAVPPAGIAGVAADDRGTPVMVGDDGTASAFGALAIGDIKYRVHRALLQQLYTTEEPVYIAHAEAYATARDIVERRYAG